MKSKSTKRKPAENRLHKRRRTTKCPLCGRIKLKGSNICGHCVTYLEV